MMMTLLTKFMTPRFSCSPFFVCDFADSLFSKGMYFGSQFSMGGQRFAALEPEAYLFGNLNDLNFLTTSHLGALYHQPPVNMRHTTTIRSHVNLRKDSLKLVKTPDAQPGRYSIEFMFDSDSDCFVTIHLFAKEFCDAKGVVTFKSASPEHTSPSFFYPKGLDQQFQHSEFVIDLASANPDFLSLSEDYSRYPLVVQLEVPSPPATLPQSPDSARDASTSASASASQPSSSHASPSEIQRTSKTQSQATIASFDVAADATNFSIKPLKQKVVVDGIAYMMQEVYGIEQKTSNQPSASATNEESALSGNTECVVCMADSRDTVVLPCRHLCLCNPCAEVLRYQSNKCPICRAPFHSLLQIRVAQLVPNQRREGEEETEDMELVSGVRLRSVPIVEALEASTSGMMIDGGVRPGISANSIPAATSDSTAAPAAAPPVVPTAAAAAAAAVAATTTSTPALPSPSAASKLPETPPPTAAVVANEAEPAVLIVRVDDSKKATETPNSQLASRESLDSVVGELTVTVGNDSEASFSHPLQSSQQQHADMPPTPQTAAASAEDAEGSGSRILAFASNAMNRFSRLFQGDDHQETFV
ncbi:hypothetical protein, variant [Capsaspora owczarzaki ATCC 30864]|uniref:RING-type E3 ubiquitin transferase n=1 Tax=Capsaspora owczarzaki (strain ATCC 30864) TaxID=595528 RepID=A0A0D2WRY2_CAPO3|nr:hypothetical protein, variant [Capsaspora owczarzaki ATCC 30864]